MGRSNELDERLNLACGNRIPLAFDRSISKAMVERRRQYLAERGGPVGGSDTATIQARIAAARAAERAASGVQADA